MGVLRPWIVGWVGEENTVLGAVNRVLWAGGGKARQLQLSGFGWQRAQLPSVSRQRHASLLSKAGDSFQTEPKRPVK